MAHFPRITQILIPFRARKGKRPLLVRSSSDLCSLLCNEHGILANGYRARIQMRPRACGGSCLCDCSVVKYFGGHWRSGGAFVANTSKLLVLSFNPQFAAKLGASSSLPDIYPRAIKWKADEDTDSEGDAQALECLDCSHRNNHVADLVWQRPPLARSTVSQDWLRLERSRPTFRPHQAHAKFSDPHFTMRKRRWPSRKIPSSTKVFCF